MATRSYPRARRVGQQVQRTLSELIRREVRDPRLGMVTLTEVRMSPDLSHAKVYYSVLGADARLAGDILAEAADLLRGPLGRSLGIRHSPQLHFIQDELIEGGARLTALIDSAVRADRARQDDDAQDDGAQDDPEADTGDQDETDAERYDSDADDDDDDSDRRGGDDAPATSR